MVLKYETGHHPGVIRAKAGAGVVSSYHPGPSRTLGCVVLKSDYRIRLARAEDIRPALMMKQQAWREAYGHLRGEKFFEEHEANLDAEVQWWERGIAAGAQFFLAELADGTIVGLAGGTPVIDEDKDTGVEIELGMLYVLSPLYGTGMGDHLLETVLNHRDALVWVIEDNARARAFYEKHGFKADGASEQLTGSWAGLREIRMVRKRG